MPDGERRRKRLNLPLVISTLLLDRAIYQLLYNQLNLSSNYPSKTEEANQFHEIKDTQRKDVFQFTANKACSQLKKEKETAYKQIQLAVDVINPVNCCGYLKAVHLSKHLQNITKCFHDSLVSSLHWATRFRAARQSRGLCQNETKNNAGTASF